MFSQIFSVAIFSRYKYVSCLSGAVALIGLFGNSIVVSIIASSRRRGQRSAVQLFLLHLAISDLLVCMLCIPLTLWVNFYFPEEDQSGASGICKVTRFVQVSIVDVAFSFVSLPR